MLKQEIKYAVEDRKDDEYKWDIEQKIILGILDEE